jgi:NAD(P) transhydrogenase subunit alpha
MKPGSVIVDLAVERGGNVEGVKAGEVRRWNGVRSSATPMWRDGSRRPRRASTPRNLYNFLDILVDKKEKKLASTGTTRSSRRRR